MLFFIQVIEYIRFLQEKAQKYEASFPEWNQENAKLLPWVIVFPNVQYAINIQFLDGCILTLFYIL